MHITRYVDLNEKMYQSKNTALVVSPNHLTFFTITHSKSDQTIIQKQDVDNIIHLLFLMNVKIKFK